MLEQEELPADVAGTAEELRDGGLSQLRDVHVILLEQLAHSGVVAGRARLPHLPEVKEAVRLPDEHPADDDHDDRNHAQEEHEPPSRSPNRRYTPDARNTSSGQPP